MARDYNGVDFLLCESVNMVISVRIEPLWFNAGRKLEEETTTTGVIKCNCLYMLKQDVDFFRKKKKRYTAL